MNKKHKRAYVDEKGYWRDVYGNLIHRQVAWEIWKSNRDKYPKHFRHYQIHHKNKDKEDNSPENLELLTPKKHKEIHGIEGKDKEIWEYSKETAPYTPRYRESLPRRIWESDWFRVILLMLLGIAIMWGIIALGIIGILSIVDLFN